jgi:hypothetical protein
VSILKPREPDYRENGRQKRYEERKASEDLSLFLPSLPLSR